MLWPELKEKGSLLGIPFCGEFCWVDGQRGMLQRWHEVLLTKSSQVAQGIHSLGVPFAQKKRDP
ncbi:hypothetical protein NW813_05290 [Synechococcus sp. R55.6]|uniref:hypothetical protein n=1 Tax=unclassified Synechococcus TaxID=2626047 RepID=UPI0039C1A483